MKDAENKFIDFLKEEGVLEELETNFVNSWGNNGFIDFKAWIKSANPRDFILFAFFRGHANEEIKRREEEKWRAIHYKWQVFIKKDGAE